jgi:class 3 adenylate cyclase
MNSGQTMANQTVTIMFADIEGFSTICETIHSDELAEVCTEYFEVMCGEMVAHHGTIDKFIGDCIMGIWNAPTVTPGHEQHAVEAALAMQTSVLALHPAWRRRSLPMLKFRLGIHTGTCLIGNFGCSYRVSYTCLGDSVNLASRLESLNKKFGTSICISQATYDGCQDRIRCRRLAKATVPGKSEILPVYEVLCLRSPEAGTADAEVVLPLEALQPLAEAKAALYHVQTAPCPEVGEIVYHWAYVNTAKVLEHCGNYEAAYDAMLDGDFVKARRLLQSGRILQIPDKAWSALEEQLQQLGPVSHWNGVFYFTDK